MQTILLAIPDTIIREALRSMLASWGYVVTTVDPSGSAVSSDLLILDASFPGGARLSMEAKNTFGTPVLLLAREDSYAHYSDRTLWTADHLVTMPFGSETLLINIHRLLNKATERIVIAWDPMIVDPADYASVVESLGDLVRSEGGERIERVRDQGFE